MTGSWLASFAAVCTRGCDAFDGAAVEGNGLDGNRLDGAGLESSTLDGATFEGATFEGATFEGVTFEVVTFEGATLDGALSTGDSTGFCEATITPPARLRIARPPATFATIRAVAPTLTPAVAVVAKVAVVVDAPAAVAAVDEAKTVLVAATIPARTRLRFASVGPSCRRAPAMMS
jgi:hypothetical protein